MLMASVNEFDVALASVLVGMAIAVVWIIAHQWRKARVAAYNARLKQLMLERGMSASEIERVIAADGKLEQTEFKGRG
jgi:biopolymer transport protein ExbB/TolQ